MAELIMTEEASTPSTPSGGNWKAYFKAGGLYIIDDAGNEFPATNSSLIYSSITPTTANVSAAANTVYSADISGLTANRNFVVPAGVAGDTISLYITTGDASFALIIIGDTGVNVGGAGAATEWSRLFITGEKIELLCTATNTWVVKEDGRIPSKCQLLRTTAQSINDTTNTKIEFDTSGYDVGDLGNLTTDRITVRRAGLYAVDGFTSITGLDDQEGVIANVFQDGASVVQMKNFVSNAAGGQTGRVQVTKTLNVAVAAYFELYIFHEEGAAANTGTTGNSPFLEVLEILP